MNDSILKKCPTCGAALDAEGVSGCPRCLMLAALQPTHHTDGADRPPPPSLAAVRAAFPQLEVLELIGQGGMGCVFKARQPQLNRFVALKILPEALSRDAAFAARFTREAQALAALSHPNIVTIHDFGQAGGFFYLLMELVDGVNLRQALRGGHFTPEQALAIVPPLCDALQFAHERGIVHRDIKPENLLLDKDGRIKVADFGIAKMLAASGAADSQPPAPGAATNSAAGKPPLPSFVTADNSVTGTPGYMAPEQKATPQRVDSRADIYSLGVVFYEMLTGELPADKLQPPSRKVQIDVRLDDIVLRALEKTPELRYQTADEMRTQVETFVSTPGGSRGEAAHAATQSSRPLKTARGFLFPPETLATADGQFFCYRTLGQFILDDCQFTHSRAGTNTVIPLAAIRDVSLGQYPRTMSPISCDLISVTWEEDGKRKQILLTPMEGWVGLPSSKNAFIAEWFHAIRAAVTAATGQPAGSTPAGSLGIQRGSYWPLIAMPGVALIIIGLLFFSVIGRMGQSPGNLLPIIIPIFFLLFFALMAPLVFAWLTRSRPVSSAPPADGKIGTWSGWGIVGTAVGLTSWIVLTAILSGWSGAGVALSEATVGIVLAAALVLWNSRHRITQFCGQMWLIAVGFIATALFIFGAHWLGLSMIASWPGGAMVSPLKLAWALWLFPLVALRLWIRNRLAPAVTPTPEPPPQSRWHGWDVWVIGLCLATFGALWLERLSGERLQQSLHDGPIDASDIVLRTALATVILLAGAAFLWMLTKNIKPASGSHATSWKRQLGRSIVPTVAVVLLLRAFIMQPFWAVSDATAPEIPRDSLVLVWKPTRTFAAGEVIAYIEKGRVNLGRITKSSEGAVFVKRNDSEPTSVLHSDIVGKVLSVLWRGTPGNAPLSNRADEQNATPAAATAEPWSPSPAPVTKEDVRRISADAKALQELGRYEEALQRHLWLQHHALEIAPSLFGVRMSFWLSDWAELAQRFPKAKQALVEIRDQKSHELVAGRGDFGLFIDVDRINSCINEDAATLALFKQIEQADPELAKQCAPLVEEAAARLSEQG